MFLTILIFIAILLVLVLSHEAGHFFSARFFGVKVEEFGFGIPPRVFGFSGKNGILYSLNLLPFGGFVKIFGEEGENASMAGSFGSKPARIRAFILGAGILANILLAYFVFTALSALGMPEVLPENQAGDALISILDISANSPAHNAGFIIGDQIKKIAGGGEEISARKISEVQNFISKNRGRQLNVFVERNGAILEKTVSPRKNPPEGEGPLGVSLGFLGFRKAPIYLAPFEGALMTGRALKLTLVGFYEIIASFFSSEKEKIDVAGPIGIFNLISSAKSSGLRNIIMFLGLLSINLAVINLLPIPGLDGGRLFFVLIEKVKGKRISPKTSALFHTAGLVILIALMLLVTYQDITRLFQS